MESIERIVALVAGADQDDAGPADGGTEGEDAPPVLGKVKEAPGNVSLETMLTEIDKLLAVRAIGLPRDLFIDVAPKVVAGWPARAAVESPSHLRTHPVALRVTLLAALLHERERESTDTLVELLISTVHRIGARAEKKVTEQLINAFKEVSGKENILFKLAEASLGAPEGTVRQVVFPAVSGGEATLRELVHEFRTRGPVYRRTVQTTLKASYTDHYRRGLIKLLDVLEFRSSNHAHRPVIEALALVARYANAGNTTYCPLGETVPVHKAMGGDWAEVVHRTDKRGRRRVVRMVYEVVAFQALRDQLKCKEIWVVGADKWRNPDEDLPQDFEARRAENYQELRKPLDAAVFVNELREQMTAELTLLNDQLGILRRFTRNASHPTYAAMREVVRARKTICVARYLRLRGPQREIEEGLNVMESSNGANSVIAYGKGGEIASNRRDEQEMFVLCLRILRSALVYVNTLMLQDILGEPEWAGLLTSADRRGLTPLFWSHVRPYGEVNLDRAARLNLTAVTVPSPRTAGDAEPAEEGADAYPSPTRCR
ncbi:Tn3 family transposase [Streptomyces sp. NPDC017991]|uniref:Tn3 family transposase n=1 Tax=Streptomyces sp. NPDC017991 TaxID=3365026 RepID=UPI00379E9F9E